MSLVRENCGNPASSIDIKSEKLIPLAKAARELPGGPVYVLAWCLNAASNSTMVRSEVGCVPPPASHSRVTRWYQFLTRPISMGRDRRPDLQELRRLGPSPCAFDTRAACPKGAA